MHTAFPQLVNHNHNIQYIRVHFNEITNLVKITFAQHQLQSLWDDQYVLEELGVSFHSCLLLLWLLSVYWPRECPDLSSQ